MTALNQHRIYYFAWVRETAGRDEEVLDLPEGSTGDAVLDYLLSTYPALEERREKLNLAINQEHADWSTPVQAGDELAVFPPVTGG
ncbi:MAG: molybdopterin converting factor subunit 1 [Sphingomonadales bacterium]